MIIHELALLTTFYNVTASNIATVEADTDFSLLVRTPLLVMYGSVVTDCLCLQETRGGYTDFTRLAFTVTTNAGDRVTVKADRCGGKQT